MCIRDRDNSLRNVLTWIADDRWSPDNQNINATYPRLTRDTSVNNTQRSDYWPVSYTHLDVYKRQVWESAY